MIQLTSRCPACWNNMRRLYCQLTCSRDQSLFMDPEILVPVPNTNKSSIMSIKYFVSPQFKQGLFDSCKDVTFPGNNEKVLNLLCGTTAEKCTPQKLLKYMGNTENGFAPFAIDFPEKLIPNLSWMNQTVFKCNNPFVDPQTNNTASVCSCQDCVASCPVRPTVPPSPTPRKIIGLDVLTFSLIVAYVVFLVIFLSVSFICKTKNRKTYAVVPDEAQANLRYSGTYPPVSSSLPQIVDSRPGLCERLGSKLESFLNRWFTKWGVWCSYHPYYVMGGCLVVIAVLACGLLRFTVTTDPVELWSAPDSTARKQKEIFDSKFKPFYRTEQLIITATNPTPTGYNRYGDGKWIPFGPVFHLDLLNQVTDHYVNSSNNIILIHFQADRWWELRKLSTRGYCGEILYNTKFSGLVNKEMYGHQLGELAFRSWEWKFEKVSTKYIRTTLAWKIKRFLHVYMKNYTISVNTASGASVSIQYSKIWKLNPWPKRVLLRTKYNVVVIIALYMYML